ncbi:MAG: glycoside hydrolase N-terminal domain-containing protein [Prolixibacteraceae bacterium]|nr:glycoside hydrolase N-terminal domain-containing protein [Prolixibacteraceae bacterium]
MKIFFKYILFFLFIACSSVIEKKYENLKLWYEQPASAFISDHPSGWHNDPEWLKALPLGNGSLGVMVFGDVNKERIQLNEESMWSGSHDANDNPDAYLHQAKIRQLLFDGKYREATELTNNTQICKGPGSGRGNGATVPFGCFQTLGDLWLDFEKSGSYENYYRELDLNDAVVRVRYTQDGVNYEREIFTSQPHQVMVARFTADKPGQISFNSSMTRPERFKTYTEDGQLILSGALYDGKGGENLRYMARLKAVAENGEVICNDSVLSIKNADEVVLLLSASTDYKLEYPTYKGRDYVNITMQNIEKASQKKYDDLLKAHTNEYSKYFNRVHFLLGGTEKDTVPTDLRVKQYKGTKNDPRLYELIFQYGRYLLISSSRPGTLPANLQGIWANKIQTPWNGDYHTDVNLEMNYWPAEITNLSEMHLPMFDLIAALVEPGKKTAQIQYQAKGWVVHPITNVWGYTSPGEDASWGMHTGAPAWICQHIGEHYRFTGDTAFIEKMYPVLKGAVEFYMDWLVVHPVTGKLVSGPAVSPENTFIAPDDSHCQISMGPTHDQQVISQLFDDFAMISKVLKLNNDFVAEVEKAKKQLASTQIGSDGRLLEWDKEYPEIEPGHRHISHLFDVHPGAKINPIQTPELAKAAEKSLMYRLENDKNYGAASIGWSAAWQISLNARLHRAEKAMESLHLVLSQSTNLNLFGNCPPFQMDNNFGTTAGIAEMLLQSHVQDENGLYIIHLLPSLPALWSEGSVSGLKARGNVTVDLNWSNGVLEQATFTPTTTKPFIVKYENQQKIISPENCNTIRLTKSDFLKSY